MLKLIIVMAIKKCNYKKESAKNATAGNIATDLIELKIPLDEDTIRKYLKEGKDLLNQI